MEKLQNSDKKEMTINDLRQEVENWRKQKPKNENISILLKPVDFAGVFIFFIILALTIVFVPLFEFIRLLILRPVFTLFHTIVVIIAAVCLRILAKPLIHVGNRAIKNNKRGVHKFIYKKGLPTFLRFFNLCFGSSLKYYLRIDTKDIRSIGKFQEWVDDTCGIEGIWIESDVNRAVRLETWCPFVGREIPRSGQCNSDSNSSGAGGTDYTEFCSKFMMFWLQDFVKSSNPEFELEPLKYMIPKGDEFCEFVYKRKKPWEGGVK